MRQTISCGDTNLDLDLDRPSVHLLFWYWDGESHQPGGRFVVKSSLRVAYGALQWPLGRVDSKAATSPDFQRDGCFLDLTLLHSTTGVEHVE